MKTPNTNNGQVIHATSPVYPQVACTTKLPASKVCSPVFTKAYPIPNQIIQTNTAAVSPIAAAISQPLYVNYEPRIEINSGMINQPVEMGLSAGEIQKFKLADQHMIVTQTLHKQLATHENQSTPIPLQLVSSPHQPPNDVASSNSISDGAAENDNQEMNAETNPYYEMNEPKRDQDLPPPYRFSISED